MANEGYILSIEGSRTTKCDLTDILKYMRFIYNNHSNSSGIYEIRNIHTQHFYIGQCSSFKKRWHQHRRELEKNNHGNKFMQNDFNKCMTKLGNSDFLEFTVLHEMVGSTKEERNKKEQETIDVFFDRQKLCYNIEKKVADRRPHDPEQATRNLSEAQKGRIVSAETKAKISATLKGRKISAESLAKRIGKKVSEETKAKMSAAHKALSEETRAKMSAAAKARRNKEKKGNNI